MTALSKCLAGVEHFCQRNAIAMSVIYLLIAVSIVAAAGFLGAFLWAVRNGQYDDDQTPAMRMLFDDKKSSETNNN